MSLQPPEPESLHQPISGQANQLQKLVHDLRASFGIVASAAGVLQLARQDSDRAEYLDMIIRNVKVAEHHLNQLVAYVQQDEGNNP